MQLQLDLTQGPLHGVNVNNILGTKERECQSPCFRAIVLGPMHTIYRKKALKIIGGIWILSAVVATPTYFDYSVLHQTNTSQDVDNTTAVTPYMLCTPTSDVFDKVNGVFILFTSYMIPQALVFSRYYRLVTFIKRQGHHPPGGLTSSFVSKYRTKIIKMLIIIAVLFSLAWLPYFVLLVGAVSPCLPVSVFLFQ